MIDKNEFPIYSESFLRQKSEPVKDRAEAEHLNESLMNLFPEDGAYAVACPQIGILKQATLVKLPSNGEFLFVCNPVITDQEGEIVMQGEGCLSFPKDHPRRTVRFGTVTVKYRTIEFEEKTAIFEGIEAVILQHEIDHLSGIIYKDRVIKPYRREVERVGRNEKCSCGSGKKSKRCCGE